MKTNFKIDPNDIPKFVPDIWSKKLLEKFYSNTILDKIIGDFQLTSSEIIKLCATRIEELRDQGMPERKIEKHLKKYTKKLLKQSSGKIIFSTPKQVGKTYALNQYGIKILKPTAFATITLNSVSS